MGRKTLVFAVFRLAGKVTVAKTRQSMAVGRVAMSTGTPPASAGRVIMAKTEQSTVVGRLAMFAGRVTAFTGKPTLAVGRLAMFVGRLPAVVGKMRSSPRPSPRWARRGRRNFAGRHSGLWWIY
jgi:hypothetical protein